MNKSSLTTGGSAVSTATLEPAVSWALTAIFHAPVPESVSVLVTGLIGSAVHAAYNYVRARASAKSGVLIDNRQFASASIVAPAVAVPSQAAQ